MFRGVDKDIEVSIDSVNDGPAGPGHEIASLESWENHIA